MADKPVTAKDFAALQKQVDELRKWFQDEKKERHATAEREYKEFLDEKKWTHDRIEDAEKSLVDQVNKLAKFLQDEINKLQN